MLPTRTALSCLARSCCINAAVTARGMQQLGLLFALEPALRHLYPEAEARAQAAAHYSAHSNTHPYMLPFYMGLLLNIEEQVAEGKLPLQRAGHGAPHAGHYAFRRGGRFF